MTNLWIKVRGSMMYTRRLTHGYNHLTKSDDLGYTGLYLMKVLDLNSCLKWSRSVVSDSMNPWTVTYQASPSMGFSRQEYWSGLPFPSPKFLLMTLLISASYIIFCVTCFRTVYYVTKCVPEPVIKCWYAVLYEINDCNNVTLELGRSNKREYFPGPRG